MLNVKLLVEPASRGEHMDRYYAQEGEWFIEIRVPKGERVTTADVHFEFEERDGDKRSGKRKQ